MYTADQCHWNALWTFDTHQKSNDWYLEYQNFSIEITSVAIINAHAVLIIFIRFNRCEQPKAHNSLIRNGMIEMYINDWNLSILKHLVAIWRVSFFLFSHFTQTKFKHYASIDTFVIFPLAVASYFQYTILFVSLYQRLSVKFHKSMKRSLFIARSHQTLTRWSGITQLFDKKPYFAAHTKSHYRRMFHLR